MKDWAQWALDTAAARGAAYADVRVVDARYRNLSTKNGKVGSVSESESLGLGVRVIADGAWGFASTDQLTRAKIEETAARAVAIARASAQVKKKDLVLVPEQKIAAVWRTPIEKDPFSVSLDEMMKLLFRADEEMRRVPGVTLAEASMAFTRFEQLFASTLGSEIQQTKVYSGAGLVATSFADNEIQKRSYPNSFGGQHASAGYELVERLGLAENARRVGEEAVALHKADKCPEGRRTIILDSSQLGLQIHESIGHPIELDRVLGMEANFAGMSFLTLDQLNHLRYGSEIVNVVADARLEHGPGLGTFGYDDEGVPAQCIDIIKGGRFTGYLSSRETAPAIGLRRSGGTMRAESWNRIPLIRMTNVSLLPGTWKLDDLIADTAGGLYLETNRSWSIDDRRLNFQFGTELAREIKNGKLGELIKNATYTGITPQFWGSCDAVGNRDHWLVWGTPNCGKGQPEQVAHIHFSKSEGWKAGDPDTVYAVDQLTAVVGDAKVKPAGSGSLLDRFDGDLAGWTTIGGAKLEASREAKMGSGAASITLPQTLASIERRVDGGLSKSAKAFTFYARHLGEGEVLLRMWVYFKDTSDSGRYVSAMFKVGRDWERITLPLDKFQVATPSGTSASAVRPEGIINIRFRADGSVQKFPAMFAIDHLTVEE